MCGIAGIVKKNGTEVLKEEIKELTDIVAHRGPDDQGYYLHNNIALGHRRLSILDLSNAGHQPMSYKLLKIIFNGEIYNYLEVKKELEKFGHSFTTNTDTEVITAAYLQWDIECVNHFNGMWAFCIYDEVKQTLFCSRDRFGVKPFYYIDNPTLFAFGSEIKQLWKLGYNKANIKILIDYLYVGYQNHTDQTFFDKVYQLKPSYNLIYDLRENRVTLKNYYELKLQKEIFDLTENDSRALYELKILKSIKWRLRSDVKVGTCLSGGLDSSFIASVAAKYYHCKSKRKFTSITAKSGDISNDEASYAQMVIDRSQLDGRFVAIEIDNLLEDIDHIVYHQEEPFESPSIFMQYYVMREANRIGCKVLLDGQGGDETLLGYERYYISFLRSIAFWQRPAWFKKISDNSKLTLKNVAEYYLYFNYPQLRRRYLLNRMGKINNDILPYLDNKLLTEYSNSSIDSFKLQYNEITSSQLRRLLNYEDKNSMAWSVETRLPFIDYEAVETAVSIKPQYKICEGWSKYILREIGSKYLPAEIAWRKNKIGFEPPSQFWNINPATMGLIKKSALNKAIFRNPEEIQDAKMKWKLLSIALWEKKFNITLDF